MIFETVWSKKRKLLSYKTTSFSFTDICWIVNFDRFFLWLKTSTFQGNFDVIFQFLESKNIPRLIFKTRGCLKQMLSKKKWYLKCQPRHTNMSFFKKYHKFWNAWSWRLLFSGLSYLYDTYHWWNFKKVHEIRVTWSRNFV